MNKTLKELIEEHESGLEVLTQISDYSVRYLYVSLIKDLIEIVKGEDA